VDHSFEVLAEVIVRDEGIFDAELRELVGCASRGSQYLNALVDADEVG